MPVNNAGFIKGSAFQKVDFEDHLITIDLDCNACTRATMAYFPGMVEHDRSLIINVSSAADLANNPFIKSCCATKAAVINFTGALRLEFKYRGVPGAKFPIVCPGHIKTGMFEGINSPPWLFWLNHHELAERIFRANSSRPASLRSLYPQACPGSARPDAPWSTRLPAGQVRSVGDRRGQEGQTPGEATGLKAQTGITSP